MFWTSSTPNAPPKVGSSSTSRSYPGICGLAVFDQSNLNGSETVAPPAGDSGVGAGGTGAPFVVDLEIEGRLVVSAGAVVPLTDEEWESLEEAVTRDEVEYRTVAA